MCWEPTLCTQSITAFVAKRSPDQLIFRHPIKKLCQVRSYSDHGDWCWILNEEVEQLQVGEIKLSTAWNEHLQKEIIKPVQDIDKEECCGENCAGIAINVVWIFHNEDRCRLTWCVSHWRQAAALIWRLLFCSCVVLGVAVRWLLHGVLCGGADLHGLIWLAGVDDGDRAISIRLAELPQKVLLHGQINRWIDVYSNRESFHFYLCHGYVSHPI